jgi:hypothetical protein
MQARTFDVKVEASAEASSKDNGTTGAVEQSRRAKRPGLGLLRALIVDIPLAVVFASFLLVLFFRHLYIEYYPRLLQQYRYSNEDLLDQYTYYHRYCTEDDLTTDDAGDLLVDTNAPVETAIDQLMTHGAVVIPEMLQPDTVRRLREYVVQRNHELKDEEEFPMYPPVNRLSYGFDATESPIVVKALEEVTNSAFFTDMMTQLLGDEDPASCELTTIAAFHTAEDQGWHSDTKEDGNALKFARSYSHTCKFLTENFPVSHSTSRTLASPFPQTRSFWLSKTPQLPWERPRFARALICAPIPCTRCVKQIV